MNFHPKLLKLISRPEVDGYFCPICQEQLEFSLSKFYKDLRCPSFKHTFVVYEAFQEANRYISMGFIHEGYNIMFNFNENRMEFFTFNHAINCIPNYDFVSIKGLKETVDTYLLFS